MLLDLLSMDNYVSYNIRVAEIFGLHAAIYLSELLNINGKAIKKAKTKDNYFKLDRKYIVKRTTISTTEQKKIDQELLAVGILKLGEDPDTVTLDIASLTSVVAGDETVIKNLKEQVSLMTKKSTTKKTTKKENEIALLKAAIQTNNVELHAAYEEWIEAVYAKLGWMSRKAVTVGENLVDEASINGTGHDLDIALKIVEIATVNGYKDMTWAIKLFNDNYRPSYAISITNVPQARAEGLGGEAF